VSAPGTWHHGLIADWWAEFNEDGPEIAYFQRFVEAGEPALDAGCGTGRLLIPYLRAGLDVDGCDASADMILRCREKAARQGLAPTLYVQRLDELDLPRRYRTIVVCGAFGLGSDRNRDLAALSRLHDHLEPGGTLVLDIEVPYANTRHWALWPKASRVALPEPASAPRSRSRAADGSELGLSARVVELDPLEQTQILEIHAERWRDGALEVEETHRLNINLYFKNELLLMLEHAGFVEILVSGDHNDAAPTGDDDFLVFAACRTTSS
jgi:SAM-dependent methyltransferase